MIIQTVFLLGFQGMSVSRETVLLTWQPDMLWRVLFIRDWRFLALILRCWPLCVQRSWGKRNGNNVQRTNDIRFIPKWMIPFHLVVIVAVKKLYYANCTLVTHFLLIFICWQARNHLVMKYVLLSTCSQVVEIYWSGEFLFFFIESLKVLCVCVFWTTLFSV